MSDSNCVRIGQGSTTPAAHPYRIGKSVCFSQVQWCLTLSGNTNDGPRVKRTPLSSGVLLSAFGIYPGLAVHPSWIDFGAKSPQKIAMKVDPGTEITILMQVFNCSQLLVWFPLDLASYGSDF